MSHITYARTNYFKVRNKRKFERWTRKLNLEIMDDVDNPGAVALNTLYREHGTWPDLDPKTHKEIDFVAQLAGHLAPGQVAILMEIGFEKMCYLAGYATAVNDKGERIDIALYDIYKIAQEKFNVDISAAEY